jgi:hypothetical protein
MNTAIILTGRIIDSHGEPAMTIRCIWPGGDQARGVEFARRVEVAKR